jgi:hypothetical protein
MSHTRPHGTGWIEGDTFAPIELASEPPGDGIGPDLTAPDVIAGADPRETRRLQRDHRETLKGAESPYEHPEVELHETQLADPREGQTGR